MGETPQAVFDRIVEAHHAVQTFARLAHDLGRPSELSPLVERLVHILPEHFAFEERGFRGIRLRAEVDSDAHERRLREDHRDLLAVLHHLAGHAPTDADPDADRWVEEVRAFADALVHHERYEASVLRGPGPG